MLFEAWAESQGLGVRQLQGGSYDQLKRQLDPDELLFVIYEGISILSPEEELVLLLRGVVSTAVIGLPVDNEMAYRASTLAAIILEPQESGYFALSQRDVDQLKSFQGQTLRDPRDLA